MLLLLIACLLHPVIWQPPFIVHFVDWAQYIDDELFRDNVVGLNSRACSFYSSTIRLNLSTSLNHILDPLKCGLGPLANTTLPHPQPEIHSRCWFPYLVQSLVARYIKKEKQDMASI